MNQELYNKVREVMSASPCEDTLYYALGECYKEDNINQAYLCYEQAWREMSKNGEYKVNRD